MPSLSSLGSAYSAKEEKSPIVQSCCHARMRAAYARVLRGIGRGESCACSAKCVSTREMHAALLRLLFLLRVLSVHPLLLPVSLPAQALLMSVLT